MIEGIIAVFGFSVLMDLIGPDTPDYSKLRYLGEDADPEQPRGCKTCQICITCQVCMRNDGGSADED